jgi:exopolysaccharide biosynthesis polyprenyl glycosylphosphotransferase
MTGLKFTDLAVIIAAFLVSVAIAVSDSERGLLGVFEMRLTVQNALFLGLYLLVWHFTLRTFGLYGSYRLAPEFREMRDLCLAVLVAVFPLVPLGVVFNFDCATPSFLSTFAIIALLVLAIERAIIRSLARQLRSLGMNLRNVIVVGDGPNAYDVAANLSTRTDLGYHIVEVIQLPEKEGLRQRNEVIARIEELVESRPIDEVFVSVPFNWQPLLQDVVRLCDEQGVWLRVMTRMIELQWGRSIVEDVGGNPVVTIFSGPAEGSSLLAKRGLDVLGAALGIIALAPVMFLVAFAIRLDSSGPIIFAQERVGYNRRRFPTYKFRTMVEGADRMQADLEHLNEASGPVFKIRRDPRITRIGTFLRKTSLDELPQLFNVLRGDMSLVGPRPLPVRDVERIDVRWHKRRFSVKPGITCLWQASGREPDFEEWIKADMEYIDGWSLGLDLKILLRTIPAVITRQGAH